MCSLLFVNVSVCGSYEWTSWLHPSVGGSKLSVHVRAHIVFALAQRLSDQHWGMFLATAVEGLISDAQNGLRRSCSSVYIIVLSQIHDAYLIAATDPITCWLKGQHHRAELWQPEKAGRDMLSEKQARKTLRGNSVTQSDNVNAARPPPSLASSFPSSGLLFVCHCSK